MKLPSETPFVGLSSERCPRRIVARSQGADMAELPVGRRRAFGGPPARPISRSYRPYCHLRAPSCSFGIVGIGNGKREHLCMCMWDPHVIVGPTHVIS